MPVDGSKARHKSTQQYYRDIQKLSDDLKERNGTGGTKTGEKRNTDREAERGGNRRSRQHRRECRFSFRQQQGQDIGKGEHRPAKPHH